MSRKRQAFGDLFETVFLRTCRGNGVAITRIPDGCKQVGKRIIRVKTPWDWALSYNGRSAFIDTKTVDKVSFAYSSVTDHQVRALHTHEAAGAVAGYVIWFRPSDQVVFIPASRLLTSQGRTGSFSMSDDGVQPIGNHLFDIRLIFGGSHGTTKTTDP